jgi:hypothetical protein
MIISSNKTCILCGKRLNDLGQGVITWSWYINCSSEGDWGVIFVHKGCLDGTLVSPMIDDGDGIIAPLSESDDDSEE